MSWLRLDDGFAIHPKIVNLTDIQFRIWVKTLCYCARFRTPNLTRNMMQEISGLTPERIAKFVHNGLLEEAEDGYKVHDWAKYQPKDPTGAERSQRYRDRDGNVTDAVTEPLPRARASRPVLPSIEGRKGTNVDPMPGSAGSAAQPPSRALCPDCGVNLAGPRAVAEHRYLQHDGPEPEHWVAAEARSDG